MSMLMRYSFYVSGSASEMTRTTTPDLGRISNCRWEFWSRDETAYSLSSLYNLKCRFGGIFFLPFKRFRV